MKHWVKFMLINNGKILWFACDLVILRWILFINEEGLQFIRKS